MEILDKNCFLIISIMFLGCINNQPTELLSTEEFRDILIDAHKIELDSVLIRKKIDRDLYNKTIVFYLESPKLMLDVLHQVEDSIHSSIID